MADNDKSIYIKEQKENRKKNIRSFWRRLCKNKGAVFGLVVIAILTLIAIFAGLIAPWHTVIEQNARERLQKPNMQHWFGTDTYGRDVFSRVINGTRISLLIGISCAGFCLIVGGFFGAAAAYFGGRFDNIVMRIMDMLMAIPATLLALTIVAALGTNMVNLVLAIAISNTPRFVRLVRSSVLTQVGQDYIEAARASGSGHLRIIFKDIIPNAMGPIIVETTQNLSHMILTASSMSYIGMGVQPPNPEWGAMISEAREVMRYEPYLIIIPGMVIIFAALAFNLLGDGLRDALDPRLKN